MDSLTLENEATNLVNTFIEKMTELEIKSGGYISFEVRVPIESKFMFPHQSFTDFDSKEEVFAYKFKECNIYPVLYHINHKWELP